MILGFLFLIGGAVCIVLALRRLRTTQGTDWVRAEDTRLVIGPGAGQDEPRVTLWRQGGVAFGPLWATYDPPQGMRGVLAPLPGSATFRVAAAVDLRASDAFGLGEARLARTLGDALGTKALLLMPTEGSHRPILLHGTARGARGSAGGIGIEQAHLDQLLDLLGDPAGLRVEVMRRRLKRAGWGGAQSQRQRGRQ